MMGMNGWSTWPNGCLNDGAGAECAHIVQVHRAIVVHFHLQLAVRVAIDIAEPPAHLVTLHDNEFQPSDLPTVMRKVFDLAQASFNS